MCKSLSSDRGSVESLSGFWEGLLDAGAIRLVRNFGSAVPPLGEVRIRSNAVSDVLQKVSLIVKVIGQLLIIGYRHYAMGVASLGWPWAGLIHSTVFVSLGQGLVWVIWVTFR